MKQTLPQPSPAPLLRPQELALLVELFDGRAELHLDGARYQLRDCEVLLCRPGGEPLLCQVLDVSLRELGLLGDGLALKPGDAVEVRFCHPAVRTVSLRCLCGPRTEGRGGERLALEREPPPALPSI